MGTLSIVTTNGQLTSCPIYISPADPLLEAEGWVRYEVPFGDISESIAEKVAQGIRDQLVTIDGTTYRAQFDSIRRQAPEHPAAVAVGKPVTAGLLRLSPARTGADNALHD